MELVVYQPQNQWHNVKFKNIELHHVFSMFMKNKIKNIEAQIGEILKTPSYDRNELVLIKLRVYVTFEFGSVVVVDIERSIKVLNDFDSAWVVRVIRVCKKTCNIFTRGVLPHLSYDARVWTVCERRRGELLGKLTVFLINRLSSFFERYRMRGIFRKSQKLSYPKEFPTILFFLENIFVTIIFDSGKISFHRPKKWYKNIKISKAKTPM